jgi:hypothetical protein
MTITYSMTEIILFIGLFLMLGDVAYKLKKSPHRKISLILIAITMFYVAMDCLWIVEYHICPSMVLQSGACDPYDFGTGTSLDYR